VQNNAPTVSAVFQDALEKVLGRREDIVGCSRTDAGVHANMFCLNIKTERTIPCENFIKALNVNLPDDIAVTNCVEVPLDFHARYSAKGKEYLYKIHNSEIKDPFLSGRAFRYPYELDVPLLHKAAQQFIGTYDFSAFCASGATQKDRVRTIYRFDVVREGDMVYMTVCGDGFLYKMVRIMVGTLLAIAKGAIASDEIPASLPKEIGKTQGIPQRPADCILIGILFREGNGCNEPG
jgi:tRNA pseudouridine38-40 synthase